MLIKNESRLHLKRKKTVFFFKYYDPSVFLARQRGGAKSLKIWKKSWVGCSLLVAIFACARRAKRGGSLIEGQRSSADSSALKVAVTPREWFSRINATGTYFRLILLHLIWSPFLSIDPHTKTEKNLVFVYQVAVVQTIGVVDCVCVCFSSCVW